MIVHAHAALVGPSRRRASGGVRWPNDLARWRRFAGYTRQRDFAERAGLTRSHLSLMECGMLLPTMPEAMRMIGLLEQGLKEARQMDVQLPIGRIWAGPAVEAIFEEGTD